MTIRDLREYQATPRWENVRDTYDIYNQAARMRERGIDVTVDHIYPLAGESVCGLHWHQNLQIVDSRVNSAKGTRVLMVPVYPRESQQLGLF